MDIKHIANFQANLPCQSTADVNSIGCTNLLHNFVKLVHTNKTLDGEIKSYFLGRIYVSPKVFEKKLPCHYVRLSGLWGWGSREHHTVVRLVCVNSMWWDVVVVQSSNHAFPALNETYETQDIMETLQFFFSVQASSDVFWGVSQIAAVLPVDFLKIPHTRDEWLSLDWLIHIKASDGNVPVVSRVPSRSDAYRLFRIDTKRFNFARVA